RLDQRGAGMSHAFGESRKAQRPFEVRAERHSPTITRMPGSSPRPKPQEERRIKALPRTVFRLAEGIAAFLAIAFAALVLWLRYVWLPPVDEYRADIVSRIEKASGTAVSVRRIQGGWE